MMRIIIILTLVVAALASASVSFRSDYEYDRKTDAFFKLHLAPMRYQWAHAFCASEDAQLMPPSPEDLEQAQKMLARFPEIGNQVWVGRAAQAIPNIDLQNVENKQNGVITSAPAQPTECVLVTVPAGGVEEVHCWQQRPFICKVEARDAPYDRQCRVFAKGFTYIEEVGSCYKISNVPYTWHEAADACNAQGAAQLLVLNSELEQMVVRNLTLAAPRVFKKKPRHWFVGIRTDKAVGGSSAEFKTIYGQTLSEAGFERWTPLDNDSVEDRSGGRGTRPTRHECGALSREDGCYEDIDCYYYTQPSICESKV